MQNYRFCIFEGVSKHDLLHSTGRKSLKNWVKIKQVGEFKQIQKILSKIGTEIFKILYGTNLEVKTLSIVFGFHSSIFRSGDLEHD